MGACHKSQEDADHVDNNFIHSGLLCLIYLSSSFISIKLITFFSKFLAMAEILTQQRYEKYAHEGYLYVLDRLNSNGSLVFWRCDLRGAGCKGRIHTTAGADRAFVKMVTQHTCADTGESGFRAEKCRIIVKFNLFIFSSFFRQCCESRGSDSHQCRQTACS
jgi:hypothetical protein